MLPQNYFQINVLCVKTAVFYCLSFNSFLKTIVLEKNKNGRRKEKRAKKHQ
jgi:hypothetical protein